jgi:hypothetical protein
MPTEFELNTTMHEKTIIPTKNTPEISLNPDGIIKITGRSMNGKITELEEQIENWINEYIINPPELTCVHIKLEYLDEINLKIYYSLLKKVESVKYKDKKFIINWYYEEDDEDILEKGEKISTILNIPFNFMMIGDSVLDECNSPIMNS